MASRCGVRSCVHRVDSVSGGKRGKNVEYLVPVVGIFSAYFGGWKLVRVGAESAYIGGVWCGNDLDFCGGLGEPEEGLLSGAVEETSCVAV